RSAWRARGSVPAGRWRGAERESRRSPSAPPAATRDRNGEHAGRFPPGIVVHSSDLLPSYEEVHRPHIPAGRAPIRRSPEALVHLRTSSSPTCVCLTPSTSSPGSPADGDAELELAPRRPDGDAPFDAQPGRELVAQHRADL